MTSEKQGSTECTIVCWAVAALVGVVSMVMLYMLAGFDGNQTVFTGGLIGFVLGLVLTVFLCRGSRAAADLASDEKPAQRYARQAAEDRAARSGTAPAPAAAPAPAQSAPAAAAPAPAPAASATPKPAAAEAASGPAVKASQSLPGQAELAARKGSWSYSKDGAAEDAKAGAIPAGETAAPAVTPEPAPEKAEAASEKPKRAPVAADGKPELYDAPPAEGADDLKKISGVGPKLEQTLNELGIYRFEQIAGWRKKEIEWVDSRLRFKGRIERDDWMSQAKVLAKGGETEFSKRKSS